MDGVYGGMLAFFAELFVTVDYFEQTALVGAGYAPEGDAVKKRIILQHSNDGSMLGAPGGRLSTRSNWTTMSIVEEYYAWSEELLAEGAFIDYKGRRYRIIKLLDWSHYAGFYGYTLDKVVGNNGKAKTDLPLKGGSF